MARIVELHGHRGARGLFPENTLHGFASTLAIGVDAIELDVTLTADDVVVVTHDARLNRDLTRTSANGWLDAVGPVVHSLRANELGLYDVGRLRPGSAYAALFPDQVPHDGAGIPTLAEVLQLDPVVSVTIELKSNPLQPDLTADGASLADAAIAVVDACGAASRVTVESFDWRGPRRVRHRRADVSVAWLTRSAIQQDARAWWAGPHPSDFGGSVPRAVASEGGPRWAPEHVDITPDTVAEAHELGLSVVPWTVNDPADMSRLIEWGVDGLVTDRPDLARKVLSRMGYPLAPARSLVSPGSKKLAAAQARASQA